MSTGKNAGHRQFLYYLQLFENSKSLPPGRLVTNWKQGLTTTKKRGGINLEICHTSSERKIDLSTKGARGLGYGLLQP